MGLHRRRHEKTTRGATMAVAEMTKFSVDFEKLRFSGQELLGQEYPERHSTRKLGQVNGAADSPPKQK